MFETIEVVHDDRGVTTVAFNRPDKRNAMSPQMHVEMSQALSELAVDDATRLLIITGRGEAFCAGQDLEKYFKGTENSPAKREAARKAAHDWRYRILNSFPKPTIAAINGYCFGGAFTVAASCDIAVAAEDATFGLSEINFGHIAGGMVSKIVTDNMIPRQALYRIMTGRPFDGAEAARIGFVTMAVPRDELFPTVDSIADDLLGKDPIALRACREAFKSVDLRAMSGEEALSWLSAKQDELRYRQLKSGTATGIDRFLAKEYRPGLGHAPALEDDNQPAGTASA